MENSEYNRNQEESKEKSPPSQPADVGFKGSKDPKNMGDNGNPAQSAARVTAQEQDAAPLEEKDSIEKHADLHPDSSGKSAR